MKQICVLIVALTYSFAFSQAGVQESSIEKTVKGNVIAEFGETFPVENPEFKTDTEGTFKAVFDIAKSPEDPTKINPYINTVARFLNMHEHAGVSLDNLKPVLVVHGNAGFDLLNDTNYRQKFGTSNPNLKLLEALHKAGIPVILCGQTAGSRNISKEKRWEHTQMALSAMTALIQLQNDGYQLIAF